MPSRQVPDGFTTRQEAIAKYGRSKSSFIRDFDDALRAGDLAFLQHFRVLLKDGTLVEGPDATKDKLQSVASLKPWWLIETSLLETRYWETNKTASKPSGPKKSAFTANGDAEGNNDNATLDGADALTQLRHQLALEKKDNEAHRKQIATLQETNIFLKEELIHRRKDMQELTELIDTMRKALPQASDSQVPPAPPKTEERVKVIEIMPSQQTAQSAAKQTKSARKKAQTTKPSRARPKKQSWTETHLPTLTRYFRR